MRWRDAAHGGDMNPVAGTRSCSTNKQCRLADCTKFCPVTTTEVPPVRPRSGCTLVTTETASNVNSHSAPSLRRCSILNGNSLRSAGVAHSTPPSTRTSPARQQCRSDTLPVLHLEIAHNRHAHRHGVARGERPARYGVAVKANGTLVDEINTIVADRHSLSQSG